MKIGIDIDDTLTNTKQIYDKYYHKYCQKNHLEESSLSKLGKEEYLAFLSKYKEKIYYKLRLKKGAKKVLKEWEQRGYQIYFITAREENHLKGIEQITNDFLKHNKIHYEEILFDAHNKYEAAKHFCLDVFIDDQEKVLDTFPKNNVMLLRFVPNKKYYSKYTKVTSWKEIKNLIK